MYRLTPAMRTHFKDDLIQYHRLFDSGRCQGASWRSCLSAPSDQIRKRTTYLRG